MFDFAGNNRASSSTFVFTGNQQSSPSIASSSTFVFAGIQQSSPSIASSSTFVHRKSTRDDTVKITGLRLSSSAFNDDGDFFMVGWLVFELIVNKLKKILNNLIFKGIDANVAMAIDMVKHRVVWWFKCQGSVVMEPVSVMQLNAKESCVTHGSARGKPGPAGIGGVLRNSTGTIICLFSLFVGIQDSNTAEILAIHKACELCALNPRLSGRKIQIVSDTMVAVSWANNVEVFRSFSNRNIIYDIKEFLLLKKDLSVSFNSRASNSEADNLAKLEWG
ncbi:hypothetical protein Ddye_007504 [Dipteronia dyeriana]|uniref:RNase H type-1 domain-containing protein n=1 Tax=Dipteronia dyeriana TaxID=168575 RepID=A0AAE0CRQ9_9ROSI|nr:hypothetical protein Ddye_007504 [Dipteronia dyeriana]